MYTGKTVFAQVIDHLPMHTFRRGVARYGGNRKLKSFSCLDQFLCMAFAQITYRESLRDIEACLRAQQSRLYHMGIRGRVSRSTLADANEKRDWRIHADLAQALIAIAQPLYAEDRFAVDLAETVYALDATTIDLSLTLFPWAPFQRSKAAVKLHTLLDLRGNIPAFIHVTGAHWHDSWVLDELVPEPGAFYVMDRGYIDFSRLYAFNLSGACFVVRGRANFKFRRLYSHAIDKATGLKCDQTIRTAGIDSATDYPVKLRRIRYRDADSGRTFTFLTNNFVLPALTVAELYKCRWQIELFFKWIKQHLRIKRFFGTSENAVKTQVWIAVSVYLLVAILKKRLGLDASLYTILQILSVTAFERTPLNQILTDAEPLKHHPLPDNQLNLFD
ncbi:MAG: IS4 family transposase [Kiloniellales bacterium]|nr:IS4 family transposase [Kiloniellales bacterium]